MSGSKSIEPPSYYNGTTCFVRYIVNFWANISCLSSSRCLRLDDVRPCQKEDICAVHKVLEYNTQEYIFSFHKGHTQELASIRPCMVLWAISFSVISGHTPPSSILNMHAMHLWKEKYRVVNSIIKCIKTMNWKSIEIRNVKLYTRPFNIWASKYKNNRMPCIILAYCYQKLRTAQHIDRDSWALHFAHRHSAWTVLTCHTCNLEASGLVRTPPL